MYTIRRCKTCDHEIHVHHRKLKHGFQLKNLCEHIPHKEDDLYSEHEFKDLLKRGEPY